MIYTLYRLKRIKYVVKIMQIDEEKLFWENTKMTAEHMKYLMK